MVRTCFMVMLVPAFCGGVHAGGGRLIVSSEFTESAEGWRVSGDSVTTDAIFEPDGGAPGGCITGIDEALGETWYFRAPESVVRRLPAAVNGTLTFSLRQSGQNMSLIDDDVVIVGPAGRLSFRLENPPGNAWTDYSVSLRDTAGWTYNWNTPATQAQIDAVLTAPTRLEIRGEYVTGEDRASLDNFFVRSAPE